MRNKSTIKHTVFVYLLLHTAIIVMLVFLMLRIGFLPGNPFLTMAVIVGSAVFALYTTHTIVQSMINELASREKRLSQIAGNLQTVLATMREYETELGRRTAIIKECGKELEQRAGMLTAYSDRIHDLVATSKSIHEDEP